MSAAASINGIVSGLDTSTIISELVSAESAQENTLKTQQTTLQTQLSTWQSINTDLLSLQTAASALAKPSSFDAQTVTSSDSSIITGTTDSTATIRHILCESQHHGPKRAALLAGLRQYRRYRGHRRGKYQPC